MRRVSSRQRLVSWDAFDATASSDDDEQEDYVTCYEASLSRNSSFALDEPPDAVPLLLSRKRERIESRNMNMKKTVSFSDLQAPAPAIIAALAWELPQDEDESLQLNDLMVEVKLHVFSFLSVQEARRVATVSKHYRRILYSPEAASLWKEWIHRRWPTYAFSDTFVDLFNVPTVVVDEGRVVMNHSVLLGLAARHQATAIDSSLLLPPNTTNRSLLFPGLPTTTRNKRPIFRTLADGEAVQYIGPVGTGDRCVRGNQPLPSPERIGLWRAFSNKASLLNFLCRGARAVAGSVPLWRPFVAPFCSTTEGTLDLTPRLVSYYEVTILETPEDSPLIDERERDANLLFAPASDCVAVGIATKSFHVHSRMPGWDVLSYGYHGDDGGIFHGSGDMTRRFGPSFGQGDTVGCGVDYATSGIFFTINGTFLGYGWTNVDLDFLQQDLYPTVGVDTNHPVQCNFGEKPFQFDLETMVERQREVVEECLRMSRKEDEVV